MWEDMGLYWAGRGKCHKQPPTKKRIAYADVKHASASMRIAATVFDDGKPTPINRQEIAWHQKHGATVTMPD